MKKKILIVGVVVFLILTLTIISTQISAQQYRRLCLSYGDCLPNPDCSNPRYTCKHDLCIVCVNENNYPTDPNRCNNIVGCSASNSSLDTAPPTLTVSSPVQDAVYDKKRVLFDIEASEKLRYLEYINDEESRPRWRTLCSYCNSYARTRYMQEGFNDLTISATDKSGNPTEVNISFFVDSKKPKIRKTYPKRRKYATGNFLVEYYEENLKKIELTYGNSQEGYNTETLTGCESGKKESCDIDINLEDYDGQEIEYWFSVRDIADVTTESRPYEVKVDITDPIITSLNYTIDGRYVYFNITIDELNFDYLEYIDNQESRPRWRRLCTRLKDNACIKKKSFREGYHNLDIQVVDEAGNAVAENIEFEIYY